MSEAPGWAFERVELVDPQSDWLERGADEARQLNELLSPWLVAPIEHVGSTAVPGLAAKPVLDLMAAVGDLDRAREIAVRLAPYEWHYVPPELDERPWRRFFVKAPHEKRLAHLHVMTLQTPRWHEQLSFRDALRANAALRERYAALKLDAASRHPTDREAYTTAKAGFIREVVESA